MLKEKHEATLQTHKIPRLPFETHFK